MTNNLPQECKNDLIFKTQLMEFNILKKKVQNTYHYLSAFGKIQHKFMIKKILRKKLEITRNRRNHPVWVRALMKTYSKHN